MMDDLKSHFILPLPKGKREKLSAADADAMNRLPSEREPALPSYG